MIGRRTALTAMAALVTAVPAHATAAPQKPTSADHYGLTISTASTYNVSFNNGVFTAAGDRAVLNVTDLENALANGNTSVTTDNGSGGDEKGDLHVEAALSWSSTSALTLDAFHSIFVDKPVSDGGAGGLTLTNNDGGSGGRFWFSSKGHVTFANRSSNLAINGIQYQLVSSIAELASEITGQPAGHFALANDYNASQDGTYTDAAIGTSLEGAVEGLGNTISNLSISSNDAATNIGLFSRVLSSGLVENLRVMDAFISIPRKKGEAVIGILAGDSDGNLSGDSASGSIKIVHCHADCSAGGLAGVNAGTIMFSSAKPRIKSSYKTNYAVGGLVGGNGGTISLSQAGGSVRGGILGGLVGLQANGALISESFSTTAVSGGYPGGLVGDNDSGGAIANSYSTGPVSGPTDFSAGLVNFDEDKTATVTSSYSTGIVTNREGSGAGSVCTFNDPTSFSYLYWNTTTSGTENGTCSISISEIVGLTTQQLQSSLPAGFDSKIWAENPNINNGLPYLINNPPK